MTETEFEQMTVQPKPPVFECTDAHVRELERAIRAEGYTIVTDSDGKIALETRMSTEMTTFAVTNRQGARFEIKAHYFIVTHGGDLFFYTDTERGKRNSHHGVAAGQWSVVSVEAAQ